MKKGYQAKWCEERDTWQLYVTLYMAPAMLEGARKFIRKVHAERLTGLPPGERKEHLRRAIARLDAGALEQVLMPQDNGETVLADFKLRDDEKTPFSDLGKIK